MGYAGEFVAGSLALAGDGNFDLGAEVFAWTYHGPGPREVGVHGAV